MIAELFLTCALALPGVNYRTGDMAEEWKKVKEFIHQAHPGAEIMIVPTELHDNLKINYHGWERLPFLFEGMHIWIRRRPSGDIRKSA